MAQNQHSWFEPHRELPRINVVYSEADFRDWIGRNPHLFDTTGQYLPPVSEYEELGNNFVSTKQEEYPKLSTVSGKNPYKKTRRGGRGRRR
jgi:hypothetical protein